MQCLRLRKSRKGFFWSSDIAYYYDADGVDRYECRAESSTHFSITEIATGHTIETQRKASLHRHETDNKSSSHDKFNGLTLSKTWIFEKDGKEVFRLQPGSSFFRQDISVEGNVYPIKSAGFFVVTVRVAEFFEFEVYTLADPELTIHVNDDQWTWIALAVMYNKWNGLLSLV